MDSVLLALRDWSCDLLLEDAEIDAERKVIQEEWRMRNDPRFRFREAMSPEIFSESQYHHTPIGTMDVVMNFPYQALRDYYHSWYRPDQQGIIVVGDFDLTEMESKVKDIFSDIPMPKDAPVRTYTQISDNVAPLFFAFEDPELKNGRIDFQIKYDNIPIEYRNTDVAISDKFARAKNALLSQYENNVATNEYWHDNIRLGELLDKDYITDHRSAIENLTLEDFNTFMHHLLSEKNRIQVNMHGVAVQ